MSKNDARAQLTDNKRFRRKWITWTRMVRYGVNNFTRNLWLTTAATAVMTITLLIVFTTFVARSVLNDTVNDIRQKVDIPINLRSDVPDELVQNLRHRLEALQSVSSVDYVSLDQAKSAYIDKFHPTAEALQVISELPTQPFYPTLKVIVKDPTNTSELESFVKNDDDLKSALNQNPNLAPSFSGEKKKIISKIMQELRKKKKNKKKKRKN
jgi:cell division transport system permease protein